MKCTGDIRHNQLCLQKNFKRNKNEQLMKIEQSLSDQVENQNNFFCVCHILYCSGIVSETCCNQDALHII